MAKLKTTEFFSLFKQIISEIKINRITSSKCLNRWLFKFYYNW